MLKGKEILEQRAKESRSLKSTLQEEININVNENKLGPEVKLENGKRVLVFNDPLSSKEKKSEINYTVFRGKWEFENLDDFDSENPGTCAVKFTPVRNSSNVTLIFKSFKDRVEFMQSIYSDNGMKQTGDGDSRESTTNSKVITNASGLLGFSLAAYGLYKIFKKQTG